MKKLSLLAVLILSASMRISTNANETSNAANKAIADVAQAKEGTTNRALRLRFISRRAYQSPAVKNKDQYKTDERESKASKRLNRQFRSKRPYINYQFD